VLLLVVFRPNLENRLAMLVVAGRKAGGPPATPAG
jgi:hypothetical protein